MEWLDGGTITKNIEADQQVCFAFANTQKNINCTIHLRGKNASCTVLVKEDATKKECQHAITIVHHEKNTTSHVKAWVIAQNESRIQFALHTKIEAGASMAQAHQKVKGIVLDKQSRITADPNLEIFHDQVSCSHGVAIGPPNKEEVLYLQARGMSHAQAVQTLTQALMRQADETYKEVCKR